MAGFKVAVLRSCVVADKREDWFMDHVDRDIDIDVMICNPDLVKTGMCLLEFLTTCFINQAITSTPFNKWPDAPGV